MSDLNVPIGPFRLGSGNTFEFQPEGPFDIEAARVTISGHGYIVQTDEDPPCYRVSGPVAIQLYLKACESSGVVPLIDKDAKWTPVCDFCLAGEVEWDYENYPTSRDDNGLTVNDDGGWAACQRCHELILKGDRKGLLHRSVLHSPLRNTVPDKLWFAVKAAHDTFWDNRKAAARAVLGKD